MKIRYLKKHESIVLIPVSGVSKKRKQRYKEQGRDYEPEIKESNKGTVTQVRRGALYDKFVNEGYALDLIQGRLTRQEIADELKCTSSHISRLLGAFQEDYAKDRQAEKLGGYQKMQNNL